MTNMRSTLKQKMVEGRGYKFVFHLSLFLVYIVEAPHLAPVHNDQY